MTRPSLRLIATLALAALCASAASAAWADSTSSAASSAGSATVGSVSDSVQASSGSSTGKRVAQGEYRVVAVAADAASDDRLRLTLQGAQDRFDLLLPRVVAERTGLATGDALRVAHEPFGLSFARTGAAGPFFLALDEGWRHEFESRIVRL